MVTSYFSLPTELRVAILEDVVHTPRATPPDATDYVRQTVDVKDSDPCGQVIYNPCIGPGALLLVSKRFSIDARFVLDQKRRVVLDLLPCRSVNFPTNDVAQERFRRSMIERAVDMLPPARLPESIYTFHPIMATWLVPPGPGMDHTNITGLDVHFRNPGDVVVTNVSHRTSILLIRIVHNIVGMSISEDPFNFYDALLVRGQRIPIIRVLFAAPPSDGLPVPPPHRFGSEDHMDITWKSLMLLFHSFRSVPNHPSLRGTCNVTSTIELCLNGYWVFRFHFSAEARFPEGNCMVPEANVEFLEEHGFGVNLVKTGYSGSSGREVHMLQVTFKGEGDMAFWHVSYCP
ncbi:hypothetical protein BU24DRAFT_426943 [Aaosphaeria arxii CBS 175.79]|uniref:Uncharacterized protein n=1 Tax=Aaosphaeria arxii CBS 175.79 TaxID=1450172 RepID=A0A6A5XCK8_9PLEO|nr:uncharacterized protein BU24DRAFT_426943 [Aaosphaeria arxii CBS 175.79]KAF2010732.1 hypothetical protein BU24DRAFT_426943 [Aaosphaeria arxii CBS 175.79]